MTLALQQDECHFCESQSTGSTARKFAINCNSPCGGPGDVTHRNRVGEKPLAGVGFERSTESETNDEGPAKISSCKNAPMRLALPQDVRTRSRLVGALAAMAAFLILGALLIPNMESGLVFITIFTLSAVAGGLSSGLVRYRARRRALELNGTPRRPTAAPVELEIMWTKGDRVAEEHEALLLEIANCEIARHVLDTSDQHCACSKIVAAQGAPDWNGFQVPEPWSGHLGEAPILFFSSNPSISTREAYPKGAGNPKVSLQNFFDSRFDGYWIQHGKQALESDLKTYGPVVKYWSSIQNRAEELLGRKARPGIDYALSEIVHCKSEREEGVKEALITCANRYMMKLLSCSGAVVLVLVGDKVLNHWNSLRMEGLPQVPQVGGSGLQEIAGRKRVVVYLAAPAGPKPKLFSHWLTQARILEIRHLIEHR
jgi:hypothetical protein